MIMKILNYIKKLWKSYKFDNSFNKDDYIINIKVDKEDDRDYHILQALSVDEKTVLPSKVDLRKYASPVKNQKNIGSCTSFAYGGSYELMRNEMAKGIYGNDEWDVSELFIYYNERDLGGHINQDSGAYMRDGCRALYKWGAGLELFWPYITSKFKIKPSWQAYFAGRWTRIKGYYKCYNMDEVKLALSKGLPVNFGMTIYSNFYSYKSGIYNKISGNYVGGHALSCVGYDDEKQAFIVKNSWSEKWGDKGYIYVDYNLWNRITFSHWAIMPYGWEDNEQ